MDDKTLINKVNEGDRSAIGLLVEKNKNLIWHIIISMVGHNSDSEDLFQEVFLRVFKGIRKYRADARLSTWMGSITHHVCVDYLRKKNKEKDLHIQEGNLDLSGFFPQDKSWKECEKEDLKGVLRVAITKLPPAFRTVITLYHLDELSYREIAEITGMPDGTVKSYISRGRNMLRESLVIYVPDIVELLDDF